MKKQEPKFEIKNVNTIHFDDDNPRGEEAEEILNDSDFKRLRNSINEVGVIVPLIVRPQENSNERFYLIDGERRLRASIAEKIETVPVRIVDSKADGRILAYQIHMHRKDWNRAAEAKSIMSIIDEEKKANIEIDDENLRRKLVEITKHKASEINDFLNLFKYEQYVIDLVIDNRMNKTKFPISYIDQIEASFISPLKRKYNKLYNKYGETKLREIMGYKFAKNLLVKTRYLMDTFKHVFQSEINKSEIEAILDSFLQNKDKKISDAYLEFESIGKKKVNNVNVKSNEDSGTDSGKGDNNTRGDKSPKTGTGKGTKKPKSDKNPPNQYKPIKLSQQQQTSINDIKTEYEKIGITFSNEELEYIREALVCLENGCFKAATLMIWSSCISRILEYIGKDISKFNTCSKDMKDSPKSFYRNWHKQFMYNAKTIEDIREASRDMQIFCFICYVNVIDKTQFDKFKGFYSYRNNCAHPTSVTLKVNEAISIFEVVLNSIFQNLKLR
jgi:ParB/RepB/Spo0J family partition protein